MKKRVQRLFSVFCTVLCLGITTTAVQAADSGLDNFKRQYEYTEQFQDVSTSQWFHDCIKEAYEYGLVRGVSETRFNPDGTLTVAESLALACRLNDIYSGGTGVFQQGSVWYQVYVDYAVQHGIIRSGQFSTVNRTATRQEFVSIMAAALPAAAYQQINVVEDRAIPDISASASYAPDVYLLYRAGILVGSNSSGSFRPASSVTRAETAAMMSRIADPLIRRTITLRFDGSRINSADQIQVGSRNYYVGMNIVDLNAAAGSPSDILTSTEGFAWYVYGIGNYSNFFMAGVHDDKVVALCSSGSGFRYYGYSMGSSVTSWPAGRLSSATMYTDENNYDRLHMVYLKADSYRSMYKTDSVTMEAEAKIEFYLTNAFRQGYNRTILAWDASAARAAKLHSQDMAAYNYFSHTSRDGRSPWRRMQAQGISYSNAGENLACGFQNAINAHNALVNSLGHRDNILNPSFQYLGVGLGYNGQFYFTEDYYAR